MGIQLTQEFVDVANKANKELFAAVGHSVYHGISNANWHGEGTIEICILPDSKEEYAEKKEAYDNFFKRIDEAGLLLRPHYEDVQPFRKDKRRGLDGGVQFCLTGIIKNQIVTKDNNEESND